MKNFQQAIKTYLDNLAATDSQFAEKYKNPKKTIENCCQYIVGEVRHKTKGTTAVMSDEEVYGMAIHYYDEDNITIRQAPRYTTQAAEELTDEERNIIRKKAEEAYISEYKQKEEELMKEIKLQEKAYRKHVAPFAGIVIRQDGIIITPLITVRQVYDEGQIMHHCVYTNEYHKKKDILLLSARHDDIPLETVELSLRSLQILQSRGKFNKPTPWHNTIINIINNNIQQIQQCIKQKSTSPAR